MEIQMSWRKALDEVRETQPLSFDAVNKGLNDEIKLFTAKEKLNNGLDVVKRQRTGAKKSPAEEHMLTSRIHISLRNTSALATVTPRSNNSSLKMPSEIDQKGTSSLRPGNAMTGSNLSLRRNKIPKPKILVNDASHISLTQGSLNEELFGKKEEEDRMQLFDPFFGDYNDEFDDDNNDHDENIAKDQMEKEFADIFNSFDLNSSGVITGEELQKTVSTLNLEDMITPNEVKEIVHDLDKEGAGGLSYNRFKSVMRDTILYDGTQEKDLRFLFDYFDQATSDDLLTSRDLQLAFRSLGETLTPQECEKFIDEMSTNKNKGVVNFAEFKAYYMKKFDDFKKLEVLS